MQELIEHLHFGVIEVAPDWQLRYANEAARRIIERDDALRRDGDRLRFRRSTDQRRAERWRAALGLPGTDRCITLPRADGFSAYLMGALPAATQEWFYLLDPRGGLAIDATAVALAFDLTPAETRIAIDLALGRTLQECASTQQITLGTVRRHLERIFHKTGCTRQPQLVTLVLRCAPPILDTHAPALPPLPRRPPAR